uniref:Uncharacterized protein n=1 Tax=Romanomermis culicivorax TaxID=13658 RepID=A0A915J1Y4_ROMCU
MDYRGRASITVHVSAINKFYRNGGSDRCDSSRHLSVVKCPASYTASKLLTSRNKSTLLPRTTNGKFSGSRGDACIKNSSHHVSKALNELGITQSLKAYKVYCNDTNTLFEDKSFAFGQYVSDNPLIIILGD